MADTDITLRIRADLDQAQRELNRMRGALRQSCRRGGAGSVVLVRLQPQAQQHRHGIRVPAVHGAGNEARTAGRVQGVRLRSAARRRSGDHAGA